MLISQLHTGVKYLVENVSISISVIPKGPFITEIKMILLKMGPELAII